MTGQSVRGAYSLAPISPNPHEHETVTVCKRSCCWTQYGHSTVRDSFPAWHREACKCHDRRET